MGCVIKYKGQSIPEEQFLQHLSKQIAINNLFNEDENLANEVYEALGFTGTISLESNLKNTGKTEQELIKYLQKKYPEIKLNITNNPVWEKGDNIFNQEEYTNQINYRLKAVDILSSDKALQIFKKGENNNWDLNKILTELQIPKQQKKIILDKDITDREEIITSLLADNSFTVEINTATQKDRVKDVNTPNNNIVETDRGTYIYKQDANTYFEIEDLADSVEDGIISNEKEFNKFFKPELEEIPTSIYSDLTVPGGTNGSYIEANIETPLITPSIKGHSQFSTDTSIGWYRMDEKQQYQEKDIENLIEIMKKSGILEVNCN